MTTHINYNKKKEPPIHVLLTPSSSPGMAEASNETYTCFYVDLPCSSHLRIYTWNMNQTRQLQLSRNPGNA